MAQLERLGAVPLNPERIAALPRHHPPFTFSPSPLESVLDGPGSSGITRPLAW